MGNYLKVVIAMVLAVSLISVIFPKNSFGKYADMLSSIIIMTILASPLLNIGDKTGINFEILELENLEFNKNSYIMGELEKELADRVSVMLKEKTGKNFSVSVKAENQNETIYIEEVEISPFSTEYVYFVAEYLGIEEGKIVQK